MKNILKPFIEEKIKIIKSEPACSLLSAHAVSQFYESLFMSGAYVFHSTFLKMIADAAKDDNPLADLDPALLTKESREKAIIKVENGISSGLITLPEPLTALISKIFDRRTKSFIEMICNLSDHRKEICEKLLGGRIYTEITDVGSGAGDSHRHGKSVAVITTDAGKIVYKPRDMRGEAFIRDLADTYLPDMIHIPACYAFSDVFGVSEFIEKKRAKGEEEAALFYRNLGGLTAFFKSLGSTDMHFENIICDGCFPAVIDLETILSPVSEKYVQNKYDPGLYLARRNSVFFTTLLPKAGPDDDHEYSSLLNCSEAGCLPEINGKYVNVIPYTDQFIDGYRQAYDRIMQNREAIFEKLSGAASCIYIRVLLANTQAYADVQKKMYNYSALSSVEKAEETRNRLLENMRRLANEKFVPLVPDIFSQLMDADIPYFYLRSDSTDLMTDGRTVSADFFIKSPLDHAREILFNMNSADEEFDTELIIKSLEQYPRKVKEAENTGLLIPKITEGVLSGDDAVREAHELFDLVCRLALKTPEGRLLWGQIASQGSSFQFCDIWLADGISGIAVFASAIRAIAKDEKIRDRAGKVTEEIIADLDSRIGWIKEYSSSGNMQINLGEAGGAGGLLCALSLIRRYTGSDDIIRMQTALLDIVRNMDFGRCNSPDRILGISSLISVLCRFEEYYQEKEMIRKAADRLMEMKQLDWHDRVLWKPFPDKNRPISGAGHGMAGIAQALYAASVILEDTHYLSGVRDALEFERDIYSSSFQTWPDLREYPPVGFMHGYCSGAPGIGIMVQRMKEGGYEHEDLSFLEDHVNLAVSAVQLRERDHLCCGNSALAEYYISAEKADDAGKLLFAMKERKEAYGSYRYMNHEYTNSVTASLFYGAAGIGYEMLRYAFPETVLSLF